MHVFLELLYSLLGHMAVWITVPLYAPMSLSLSLSLMSEIPLDVLFRCE